MRTLCSTRKFATFLRDSCVSTGWSNWTLLRKLKYFMCCLIDLFLFLVWHLSNRVWKTSISGVKSTFKKPPHPHFLRQPHKSLSWKLLHASTAVSGERSVRSAASSVVESSCKKKKEGKNLLMRYFFGVIFRKSAADKTDLQRSRVEEKK